jgi:hypothetical protein
MARPPVDPHKLAVFYTHLQNGLPKSQAASLAGISYSSARRYAQQFLAQPSAAPKPVLGEVPPHPLLRSELTDIARDCLDDFGRFRARFFGRISTPWQENAAHKAKELLDTPHKEFLIVNCPPGSGKTTLFTHDIPAWQTAQSRSIRGLVGAATQNIANRYNRRLRNSFARAVPLSAQSEELALGLARDADSTLPHDYGPFRPDRALQIPWSGEQFTVLQFGETMSGEKEATWTAFGRDTEVLSHRVNEAIWDDLVTGKRLKTLEMIEADRQWWHNEAESRLEPGGLIILQGQRLHPEDLYRYCRDLEVDMSDIEDHLEYIEAPLIGEELRRKQYHLIKYQAHSETTCRVKDHPKMHRTNAPPFDPTDPENSGCLLDPRRLSWRQLRAIKDRPNSNYEVVYQQNDVDPTDVLVPEIWINGGEDDKGNSFVGCWDNSRSVAQIPKHLDGIKLSVVTVDPSPAKYWAIQWWLYVQAPNVDHLMGTRYLLDMHRGKMDGPDLLDWNTNLREHTGLLAEWQSRAKKLGFPINFLIVEKNGAQRFLLQYMWFRNWLSQNSIQCRPHETQSNKSDPDLGVETIKHHYKFGRVNFPGTPAGRLMAAPLVRELTHYPDVSTTDCVMANWFLEFQLQFLVIEEEDPPNLYDDMPSWLNRDTAYA